MPKLYSKKVFDPALRYMFAMEICNNFSLYFLRSIKFGSMEYCFILRTDVSGLITFLNERNLDNKTQVKAIYFKPHIRYTFCSKPLVTKS